jgi:hypothetical protein
MINSLNFSLFPSDELFTFAKGALTIVQQQKEQTPGLAPFIGKATTSLTNYQSALERERKNPFTLLLAEKDGIRDSAFLAFRTLAEAASYRAKPGWNTAASKILEIIRRQGWSAAALGYKAETAALTNMISEIKGKCATELTLIIATEWLNELEEAQQAFETVAYQSVTSAPVEEPTIWQIRPLLTNALKSLFSMISLLQSATPTPELAAIEPAINELIVRSLSTVKAADTRAENKKGEEGNGKI